jgi:putative DNA primase/helicase
MQNKTSNKPIKFNSWWKKDANNREKLNPPTLAEYIMQNYYFILNHKQLYMYNNGVYTPNGDQFIQAYVAKVLGNRFRSNHLKEVLQYIYAKLANDTTKFDTSTRYINCENGLLEWQTGRLIPHNPNFHSSIRIPLHYDPNATCPSIQTFLGQVLPIECHELALEMFGYCLLPTTKLEKAFLLTGTGANGKSVFLKLLKAFIGSRNTSAESLHDIAENRFRPANLTGKLANICADLNSHCLPDSSQFKKLVSGDDMSVERKNVASYEFNNFARMFFSANELPRSADSSNGYIRRWVILRFPNHFPAGQADPNLLAKLITPQELSGLLNLVLPALRRLMTINKFSIPTSVANDIDDYRKINDSVAQFIEEYCSLDSTYLVSKQQLFHQYSDWAKSNNYKAFSVTRFNQHLQTLHPTLKEDRNSGIRRWRGIGIIGNC